MKIMIFGANGMIGHRVLSALRSHQDLDVYGVIRKESSNYKNYNLFNQNIYEKIEVMNWSQVEKILENLKPDIIVNALGITIRKQEIADLELALNINSFFPKRLQRWAQGNNARVIQLSTDCVFDGASGQYLETSQTSAIDNYGRSKYLGELEGENALTLRFSCIGRELDAHTELLDWFLFQKSKSIKGYSNAMYSGLTSTVIAKEICRIIREFPNLNGIYQLSSDPISKYDLLCLAKTHFKLDVEIEKFDNYVSDKTLNCDKYKKATGFKPASWDEMMRELASDQRITYKTF